MTLDSNFKRPEPPPYIIILILTLVVVTCAGSVCAQSAPTEAEAMQKRVARARALTAAHNLTAAAFELDAIRTSTTDEVLRDVARIMLMGIYLEQADYGRAKALLDETFKVRSKQNERSCRSYFAVAGQTVNGVRSHLERFRALGLNIGHSDLPTEAVGDLDQVRSLLEHVAGQAKEIGAEDNKNTDAFALLEDVSSVRSRLARNAEERLQWQGEMADARQNLAASETRVASLTGGIALSGPPPLMVPAKDNRTSPPISSDPKVPATTGPSTSETSKTTSGEADSREMSSTAATGQPVFIGSLLDQAIEKVNPAYPAFAKSARVSGIVRVDLIVDEKGTVVSAQSSNGPSVLRQAAIDASKRWKFRSTIKNGRPVSVAGFLNFNFTPK